VRGEHVSFFLDVAPEITQHLHRALIGDVGTWRVGQPSVAIHHHVFDAVGRQQRSGGRARRTGTDDENVRGNVGRL
jgi:hypothetical protein